MSALTHSYEMTFSLVLKDTMGYHVNDLSGKGRSTPKILEALNSVSNPKDQIKIYCSLPVL